MSFKEFFNEEDYRMELDIENPILQDLKQTEIVNAASGFIGRHNVYDQSKKMYIDELSLFFIEQYKKFKEKFFKMINSNYVMKILRKFKYDKKITRISQLVIIFLKDVRFADFLVKKLPGLSDIMKAHEERDKFLRKEVEHFDITNI